MNLFELLKMRDFDVNRKIKLVRHQHGRYDMDLLYREGLIEFYQSLQSKEVFRDCDYVLSFIGSEGTKSVFIGAYEKVSCRQFDKTIDKIPATFPYLDFFEMNLHFYHMEKLSLFDDLIDRLVIDWGKATRSWHQWLDEDQPEQVIEILPKGYVKEFPGFDDFTLTYGELQTIIKNPDANRQWHTMLTSVAGVYLP